MVKYTSAFVTFIQDTQILAEEYDVWGTGFVNWPEIPWRRSTAQFMLDEFEEQLSQSFAEQAHRSLKDLDHTIRSIEAEAHNLAMPVPRGVPPAHWWHFVSGSPFSTSDVC
mmetsp:Transcript_40190/g.95486  ORF Transcript_40190/g.95486 Transcript_40190/m.95486 type:complete len:111 (+) Transcript_40190:442-774(+)